MTKAKGRRVDRFETWALDKLKDDPRNTRIHPEANNPEMDKSLTTYGQTWPLLIQPDGTIIAGHWRRNRMQALGWSTCKVLIADGWSKREIQAYLIADNSIPLLSEWDADKLADQIRDMISQGPIDQLALGFTQEQLDEILNPKPGNTGVSGSLAAKFGVPPFTVLNAREGWWQNRKSLWIQLGIKSELGRAEGEPKPKPVKPPRAPRVKEPKNEPIESWGELL